MCRLYRFPWRRLSSESSLGSRLSPNIAPRNAGQRKQTSIVLADQAKMVGPAEVDGAEAQDAAFTLVAATIADGEAVRERPARTSRISLDQSTQGRSDLRRRLPASCAGRASRTVGQSRIRHPALAQLAAPASADCILQPGPRLRFPFATGSARPRLKPSRTEPIRWHA